MKLEFEHPGMVSIGSRPDVIVCNITAAYFFSNADGPEDLEETDTLFKLVVPRQFSNEDTEVALVETYEKMENVANSFVVGNILLTIFFGLSFKAFWYLVSVM